MEYLKTLPGGGGLAQKNTEGIPVRRKGLRMRMDVGNQRAQQDDTIGLS